MHKLMFRRFRSVALFFVIVFLFTRIVSIFGAESAILEKSRTQNALKKSISYSCTGKPIDEVLIALAELADIDIVKSPQVTGNVTVKITEVPLEEALSNILGAHNYTYVATENMIRVLPAPQMVEFREQLVTRIYQITYADANEVALALTGFISPNGRVALNRGTSHIMVTDTQDKIRGIDKFVEQVDKVTSQVLVEVRIYDVIVKEGFELEPNWYLGRNTPLETIDSVDTLTKTGVNTDAPDELKWTEITHRDVEGQTPEAFILDPGETLEILPDPSWIYTEESDEIQTETQEILNPDGYSGVKRVDTDTRRSVERRRKPFVAGSFDREIGGTLSFSLLNDAVDLEFALTILRSQVEAKLLANPRILVLDNETANFEIIREVPYRELRQVAREDPITYTEFKNVGVQLKVTPHIARDGLIKLRIQPELGDVVSFNLEGVPMVDTRRADTTALIRDGQTIVLGGLRKKETTKDISKVPVFADLPLLGGLFKAETESLITSELVIFITTRIIEEAELTKSEEKQLEETKFEMPEITKGRLESRGKYKSFEPADKDIEKVKANEISDILKQLLKEE